jgi:hypothetical protein
VVSQFIARSTLLLPDRAKVPPSSFNVTSVSFGTTNDPFAPLLTNVLGLAIGGLYGVQEGMRRNLGTSSFKLRLNSVLNSVTRRGSFLGNSLGVLGEQQFLFHAPLQHTWKASVLIDRIHAASVRDSLDVQRCQLDDRRGARGTRLCRWDGRSSDQWSHLQVYR